MMSTKTKRIRQIVLIVAVLALILVGGCGKKADSSPATDTGDQAVTSSAPQNSLSANDGKTNTANDKTNNAADNNEGDDADGGASMAAAPSDERIGFITQEYDGDNIVEIPYFEYDGEMNPELDSINRLLNQGLQFSYERFLEEKLEHEWIEIRSYPFSTDKYLQVVITNCVYPNYGIEGEIESINYDRIAKKWLGVEDALSMEGITEDDVLFAVGEYFVPEAPGELISSVNIAGFLILDSPGGERIEFLLNVSAEIPEDTQRQILYSYLPNTDNSADGFVELSTYCLFDPYNMDQMDPPLAYQRQLED